MRGIPLRLSGTIVLVVLFQLVESRTAPVAVLGHVKPLFLTLIWHRIAARLAGWVCSSFSSLLSHNEPKRGMFRNLALYFQTPCKYGNNS